MNGADPPDEILAALVWDVPRLRAGSRSAQDFAVALPGEPELWWRPRRYPADALGRAAEGVARERANAPNEAAELFASLVADDDPWVRVLGLMLRAWSAAEDGTDAITAARAAVDEVDPEPNLRARLLAKLATNAFDDGNAALGRELLGAAIVAAPALTKLHRVLAIEGLNVGLPYQWREGEPPFSPDPLVDYPWIEYDTLAAAQAVLAAAVETQARRLWTTRWRFGGSPLEDIVGAEVQATWAGALWLRRPIRKQLGAHLLMGAAATPRQWAYGVVMWALGSGDRPDRAFALAEPALDQPSTDFLVRTLGEAEVSPRYGHRFLSVAAEAWDELSDDTLRWVVDRVEPIAGDAPDATLTQRVWAGFAARLEEEWRTRFAELDGPAKESQLEMLGVETVTRFSPDARSAVFDVAARKVSRETTASTQLLRILVASAPDSIEKDLRDALSTKASTGAIAHLVFEGHRHLLRFEDVARARDALVSGLRRQSDEARRGKVTFGSTDLRLDLGRLLAASAERDDEAIALLFDTAVDPSLPSEHMMSARTALTLLRRAGKLDEAQLKSLHAADDPPGTLPEHGDVSVTLLRLRRLQILALELTSDEALAVVAAGRAEDPRVRQVALVTAGESVRGQGDVSEHDALAWAVVSGLFDPVDDVVRTATGAVTADFLERYIPAGRVAMERLPRLQHESGVELRAAVAALAHDWERDGSEIAKQSTVQSMLARARSDRSWIVRTASRS